MTRRATVLRGSLVLLALAGAWCLTTTGGSCAGSWPGWIPDPPSDLGWSQVPGGQVSWLTVHPLVNPAGGASNDTFVHARLLDNTGGDILLAVYIDLEASTGTALAGDVFSLPVQGTYRADAAAVLATWTAEPFTGATAWDLIVFTFQHAWNAQLAVGIVDVEVVQSGPHPCVLLAHNGTGDLGLVLFANLATRLAIVFNVAAGSAWQDPATFNASIPGFLAGFLSPLVQVLHAARLSQASILPSGPLPVAPAGTNGFLDREAFVNVTGVLIGSIPRPSFPLVLSLPQVIMIVAIVVLLVLVIHYSLQSHRKESSRLQGAGWEPRDAVGPPAGQCH